MKNKHSMLTISILLVCFLLLLPTHAMAKGIFDHQNTIVPENQSVDDVIVIGGDATILGTVTDGVIVFNGDVNLKSSAKVNGFVFVIGGNVRAEQGAVVTDEIIDFSFDTATKNSLLIGGGIVVGTWLSQLAVSILLVMLSVLIVFVSKSRMNSFVDRARRAPGSLLSIGFFSSLILIALSVLLFIMIIGIPLAVMILIFIVFAFIYGFAVLSMVVGSYIRLSHASPDWLVALTGSAVLVSFMNIPLIGALLFFLIMVYSIGIITLWVLEKWKKRPLS
ncbi:hypothetical protein [Paenibacillus hexagrammi]|uniref:Uncharacterized protein n=1 Tax=Paenibacillus hexagrammi TaxID=2908839 RepID=A0ABY3SQB4_9BACL|nr:hypothetical protein [Paenibacillus sp. YPD9-1]UJF35653.1 hypothetical protein L0M14_11510 [Paenibacillus sp. YPD9-1]